MTARGTGRSSACPRRARAGRALLATISSSVSPRPTISPDLVGTDGMPRLERLEEPQRVRVVGARTRLPVESRNGFEVVVHHVRERRRERIERRIQPPAEIGHQHFDPRLRRMFPDRADAVGEMPRAAVAKIVAVDAGDHDVAEPEPRRRPAPRCSGSSGSAGFGRPCATSQNGQRRVHRSPRIMNVAVPLPKHSPMFGQAASSQTVWSRASRRICLISWNRATGTRRFDADPRRASAAAPPARSGSDCGRSLPRRAAWRRGADRCART